MHPADLQAAITNARDFETAKLEANHTQAVNLVMNESSELNSKLKQFSDSINQKLEGTVSTDLPTYDTTANLLSTSLSTNNTSNLSTAVTTYLSVTVSSNLSTPNSNTASKLTSKQNPKAKTDTTELEFVNEDALSNNQEPKQKQPLTSNILPATISHDKSLAAIFSFELEKTTPVPLFSRTILNTKLITTMYTDAKIDGHSIKLILNSKLAGSIITRQLMDQLGCQVDQAASAKIIIANEATKTLIGIILQKTSTINNHPKVAESEIIGTNHLEFAKVLFQQYSQQLGLNNNHFPVESAFNFYVNNKITNCLGGTVNIESARENFYTELFQHTSLPKNYSFAPIIREINQTIKRYTQQQFPITYADKGKGRLQIPAPSDFEYLNHQIHIWIAAHQATETLFETEEKNYQTAPVFDLLSSESDSSTQTVTPEPMANDIMQANILAALQDPIEWLDDFERAATANQYDKEYKFQIVGGYLQGSLATWFSQETDTNAQHRIIR
ncbi:hypothetical protein G9A89_014549 [Geosiphon pyriformis]|nr:hypothetical protein G9A89_014549 [Geosiphon pyriformis]